MKSDLIPHMILSNLSLKVIWDLSHELSYSGSDTICLHLGSFFISLLKLQTVDVFTEQISV